MLRFFHIQPRPLSITSKSSDSEFMKRCEVLSLRSPTKISKQRSRTLRSTPFHEGNQNTAKPRLQDPTATITPTNRIRQKKENRSPPLTCSPQPEPSPSREIQGSCHLTSKRNQLPSASIRRPPAKDSNFQGCSNARVTATSTTLDFKS